MTLVIQILVFMTEFACPVMRKGVSMKLSAIAKKDIMATFVGLVSLITRLLFIGFIIVVNYRVLNLLENCKLFYFSRSMSKNYVSKRWKL